jgi:purine-binding chemotaxis protein CheW
MNASRITHHASRITHRQGEFSMDRQLVVFELATEHYGVDIGAVQSIIKMETVTVVPRAPAFVEGVINLRGTVLPVLDLRLRFGLAAEEATKDTRIVVVEIDGTEVGMVVNAVSEVLMVGDEEIEPPSPVVTTVDSAFITGIAKVGGRLIILLDLTKVLSAEETGALEALQEGTAES